ncbi:flagellar biosynthetic protein FliP [Azorhizobium oxalatiphilum]|uniref:Flagellar biosynthetic protein FliP n=1 Tax=Azorhizobium oxalatiphilum TaxID=980631 RepID=A0A917F561_9HYPH|nr:flagellar biosynthetic protein FliP [Azorhizobium oxalatiphilum]GGF47721.1 flagellar biosynthetic protein FliP [Azorhizobium oxalatiphilum]
MTPFAKTTPAEAHRPAGGARLRAFLRPLLLALIGLTVSAGLVYAQTTTTNPGNVQLPSLDALLGDSGGAVSGRIIQMVALLTVLSIAPGLLIMVTSFTRFVIALSFLRSGLGLQSTPANLVLISLSLFMTFYVMGPTFDRAWNEGIRPLTERQITEEEAYGRITEPFRQFMLSQVRPKDLRLFADIAAATGRPSANDPETAPQTQPNFVPGTPEAQNDRPEQKIELRILIPAFMISELRRGFEIGFLIILPFLIIDMIVATLVMSMGMMMMSPVVLSLPFKILFFVLIDGWNLLVSGLVRSYM